MVAQKRQTFPKFCFEKTRAICHWFSIGRCFCVMFNHVFFRTSAGAKVLDLCVRYCGLNSTIANRSLLGTSIRTCNWAVSSDISPMFKPSQVTPTQRIVENMKVLVNSTFKDPS